MKTLSFNRKNVPLISGFCLIICLAAFFRVTGLDWGLPNEERRFPYHPDEIRIWECLARMNAEGSYNPHYFINPSLQTYIVGMFLKGEKILWNRPFPDFTDKAVDIGRTVYCGRWITTVMALLTIVFLMQTSSISGNQRSACFVGLVAALFPCHVLHSHFLTVEVPSVFWGSLFLVFLARADRSGSLKTLYGAAVFLGLAISTKYSALLYLPVFYGYLFLERKKKFTDFQKRHFLFLIPGVIIIVFLLGTPYAFLDFRYFISEIVLMLRINLHAPDFAYPFFSLLRFCFGTTFIPLLLAAILSSFRAQKSFDRAILAGLLITLFFTGISGTPFMRHMVISVPFVALLTGQFFSKALKFGRENNRIIRLLIMLFYLIAFASPLMLSARIIEEMTVKDSREDAAAYINSHIAEQSKIGVSRFWFYTPPFNYNKFTVQELKFDPRRLDIFQPDVIILSDLEYRTGSYIRRFFSADYKKSEEFLQKSLYSSQYSVQKRFSVPENKILSLLEPMDYPPHDWLYLNPTIIISEKK